MVACCICEHAILKGQRWTTVEFTSQDPRTGETTGVRRSAHDGCLREEERREMAAGMVADSDVIYNIDRLPADPRQVRF